MPDYEQMYHIMVQAAEKAMDILAKAERQCEELYVSEGETEKEKEQ